MFTKRDLLLSAALAAITASTAKSVPVLAQTSADRPAFFKAKDIAEAGFIYGLPIVMNYGVMYEYAVDRNSGQFKAPFNQIKNEPNVFTYKDTAIPTPNSDTPYSFAWMDLRAEPIVLSVPAVDPKRYYSVMLCDDNTYNYGYIGSRAGDYMVVGPDWKGATPAGIKKVFRSSTQFAVAGYRTQLFNPDDAAGHEDERGWVANPLHPEQIAGRRQGSQLAAGSKRRDLSGHAALLAEDRSTFDIAPGRRDMAAARHKAGRIERHRERPLGASIALDDLIASARG
jgi:hypothetical protein